MINKIDIEDYRNILKETAESDQKMRKDFRDGKIKWNKRIDKINSSKIKKIILEIGWPSAKKVGAMCEKYAWLVVQHSPDQLFQKDSLLLMKKESGNKKLTAYLEDRIRISEGRKQLYGTQFCI